MRDNQYFYAAPSDILNSEGFVFLGGAEAYHCAHVLRKRPGDEFYVVDGVGHEYVVALEVVSDPRLRCRILETRRRPNELAVDLTLAQAILKRDHFDLAVEKAVELGANRIIPVRTRRCIQQADDRKVERWRKVGLEAMKQSRRCVAPVIDAVTDLEDVVRGAGQEGRVLCHEDSAVPWAALRERATGWSSVIILIGPEGGFTEEETGMALQAGWASLSLGQRRLKAETAAFCSLSLFSNLHSPPLP